MRTSEQPRPDDQGDQQYGSQNPYGAAPADPYGQATADPYGQASAAPQGEVPASPYGAPSADPSAAQWTPVPPSSPAAPPAASGAGSAQGQDPSGQAPGRAQNPYGPAPGQGQDPYGQAPGQGQGAAYGQVPGQGQGPSAQAPGAGYPVGAPGQVGTSRLLAGLLGIFLGGWGVHRFVLGYTAIGVIQILVTIFTFGLGSIWGLIEGIMILAKAEPFTRDAQGRPLVD